MTKTTARPTLADLAGVPPVSAEYGTPPLTLLPESLRPLAQAVRDAADRIPTATANRKAAESLVDSADRDYDAALDAAERAGQPLDKVADFRPQRHADLARMKKFEKTVLKSARTRWAEFIRALCDQRADVVDIIELLLDQAQADAIAAAEEFRRTRRTLDQATGLAMWVHGLKPKGNASLPVSTLQGPRQEKPNPEIAWKDSKGRITRIGGTVLIAALSVYARGLDALNAQLRHDKAIAARVAGDVAAQRAPVPSAVVSHTPAPLGHTA